MKEKKRLNHHIHNGLLGSNEDDIQHFSWSSYHAQEQRVKDKHKDTSALMPLFNEKSNTHSMIKHSMDLVKTTMQYLNKNQTPVMCFDQPLYTICKTIQWNWPEIYGEDKFVILMGLLHIEQSFLRILGQVLEGSGWVDLLANSNIITEGSAESVTKVTHILRARRMHQISAATLYSLLIDAHENEETDKTLHDWIDEKSKSSPMFKYWFMVLNLQILLLTFVRSVRSADFVIFKQSLKNMIPWYFLFSHYHYSRWLSVHIKDLEELQHKAPDVYEQFRLGKFLVQKSTRSFSALGVDHAHESGAIGLT
ncbi:unnamed protein product [Ceutorhynchus assimilis]|uniref:Uncharacterized protein n=1 Tax=Ceutorhynchus assimilis TaxID=467358 RepID=A0A9N9MQL1_9CUCU|nr:unnamed protein product [Ceutorhynchus assimilis]